MPTDILHSKVVDAPVSGGRNLAHAPAAYDPNELLVAIVDSSEDAIISKTLDGIITSWNGGAEQLFGYRAEEAIGQPITMLIPEDRLGEEPAIVAAMKAGKKVHHFETKRRRRDGSLVDVSLTSSPIRDRDGVIIGASKVARDISLQKQAEEQQGLLLREMHHRVKNLFALTSGLITMASKSASSPSDLAASMRARLAALAAAHDLTMPNLGDQQLETEQTTLLQLVRKVVAPYQDAAQERISVSGQDLAIAQGQTTSFALLFHELATNAAKYGALSVPNGKVFITSAIVNDGLSLEWREACGPKVHMPGQSHGFGTRLIETMARALPASIEREWAPDGLVVKLKGSFGSLDDHNR